MNILRRWSQFSDQWGGTVKCCEGGVYRHNFRVFCHKKHNPRFLQFQEFVIPRPWSSTTKNIEWLYEYFCYDRYFKLGYIDDFDVREHTNFAYFVHTIAHITH